MLPHELKVRNKQLSCCCHVSSKHCKQNEGRFSRPLGVVAKHGEFIWNNALPLLVEPIINERAAEIDEKKEAGRIIPEAEWETNSLIATTIVVQALMEKFPDLQGLHWFF